MTAAIETTGLTKDYGGARGLFDLDLEVETGEVFGYLGPNGSGKSTTIRLLMGLIHPTAGVATVLGLDAMRQSVEVKRHAGFMPAELPQFGGLRGHEIAGHFGALRGGVDPVRVKAICDRFDLDLGLKFRQYSTGNKRKLAILLAFMHQPKLLILDEPTSGLDPLNQQEFFGLVREARTAGATVLLSSHVLSEVEHICQRVGIIRRGHLVKVARLEDLHALRVRKIEVEFASAPEAGLLANLPGIDNVEFTGRNVTLTAQGSLEPLLDALAGHHVVNFVSHEPTLEDIFLSYYEEIPAEVPA